MIIFIAGLPGSGKSTVAARVAQKLGYTFVEADAFLTEDMKNDIRQGKLLTDTQLDAWVMDGLVAHLISRDPNEHIVAAGMLAKPEYVQAIVKHRSDTTFINLDVSYEVLKERVTARSHFAGIESLNLCWEARERLTVPGSTVNGNQPIEKVVNDIIALATA